MKNPAVILGAGVNALGIVQTLGRRGVPAWVADEKRRLAGLSRYAKFYYCRANPYDLDAFTRELVRLSGRARSKPVLIPTTDEFVQAVSQSRGALQDSYHVLCPSEEAVRVLLDKCEFQSWAAALTLPVPKVWSLDEVRNGTISFPLVAKPRNRRPLVRSRIERDRLFHSLDSLRLSVLSSRDEVAAFLSQNSSLIHHFSFEEYIEGWCDQMRTLGVFAVDGEIRSAFYGKKVRGYPALYGDCVVGESLPISEEAMKIGRAVLSRLNYSGIAEIELKVDSQGRGLRLIEVNPRSWSWIGLCQYTDANLALQAYSHLTGDKIDTVKVLHRHVFMRPTQDFEGLFLKSKNCPSEWRMPFKRWWNSVRDPSTYCPEFQHDDPLVPLVVVLFEAWRAIGNFLRGKYRA